MHITSFQARDFRNLARVELEPCEGVNVVFGENGQGKTNLLEGIWLFTGCRSFRGADTGGLIDMSAEELSELGKTAASYNIERVMSILDILSASYDTAKYSSMPRLVCEMAIIRAAYKNPDAPAPSLKEEPAPITETIPEVKEEEEIVGDAALNVPHKIEIEKAEEEIKQPSDGVSSIIDNWDDIVSLIAREGGGYISSSIKSCEFRVNGDRLTILDTMLANKPEYTSAVEKAVFDICGARVKVEFQTFDLLKKVAGELDGQIKIIG